MCTVSIIPLAGCGLRLVTNRDESPRRAAASPPEWRDLARGGRAVWPTDGQAGGTWVGASDRGLVLAILNRNLESPPPPPPAERKLSRGTIIPALLGHAGAAEAVEAADGLELDRFEPFRLVAASRATGPFAAEAVWDGRSLSRACYSEGPVCFVSSGLGDRLVEPRLGLFEQIVVDEGHSAETQDRFHAHSWPDRRHVSVMMTREGAKTVSVTRVGVRPADAPGSWDVSMDYRPTGVAGRAVCGGV